MRYSDDREKAWLTGSTLGSSQVRIYTQWGFACSENKVKTLAKYI